MLLLGCVLRLGGRRFKLILEAFWGGRGAVSKLQYLRAYGP